MSMGDLPQPDNDVLSETLWSSNACHSADGVNTLRLKKRFHQDTIGLPRSMSERPTSPSMNSTHYSDFQKKSKSDLSSDVTKQGHSIDHESTFTSVLKTMKSESNGVAAISLNEIPHSLQLKNIYFPSPEVSEQTA